MTFNELEKMIDDISKNYRLYISFATNSVKIGFFKIDDKNADFYLWMNPPWRITQNGSNVINSFNYPYHQNYSEIEETKEREDFARWADQADDLKNDLSIVNVKVSSKGDLQIRFQNEYELDDFVNDTEMYAWYLNDNINRTNFEVSTGIVKIETYSED